MRVVQNLGEGSMCLPAWYRITHGSWLCWPALSSARANLDLEGRFVSSPGLTSWWDLACVIGGVTSGPQDSLFHPVGPGCGTESLPCLSLHSLAMSSFRPGNWLVVFSFSSSLGYILPFCFLGHWQGWRTDVLEYSSAPPVLGSDGSAL